MADLVRIRNANANANASAALCIAARGTRRFLVLAHFNAAL